MEDAEEEAPDHEGAGQADEQGKGQFHPPAVDRGGGQVGPRTGERDEEGHEKPRQEGRTGERAERQPEPRRKEFPLVQLRPALPELDAVVRHVDVRPQVLATLEEEK